MTDSTAGIYGHQCCPGVPACFR